MDLTVVILNYKQKGLVKNCLKSVFEKKIKAEYEVIVVDNKSEDGCERMLKKYFPGVKFIQAGRNLGMGAGNNLGIKSARGRYVLVMNPDIFVFDDSINKLLDYIKKRSDVGVVAPRLLNADKSLQYTCYRWHNFWTPAYRRTFLGNLPWAKQELERFLMTEWDRSTTREVDWIQGSFLLFSKKALDEAGYFDDRFFMYFEDTDLCRRIKSIGYRNIYFSEAEVIHLHRRQSAEGGMMKVFLNKLTRVHISSWLKYMWKWRKRELKNISQ